MKYKLLIVSLLLVTIMSFSVMAFAGSSEANCEFNYSGSWVESGTGNGCLLDDGTWSGVVMYCVTDNSAEAGYEIRDCAAGTYCDQAKDFQEYCATENFFKKVCLEEGGVWDSSSRECNDEVVEPEKIIGECPSGECENSKSCTEGNMCVEGFYCLDGDCEYPGDSQKVCELVGGEWAGMNYESCLIGDDETVGEVTWCKDETTAGEGADYQERDCWAGTYCAAIGSYHYCAPADFSEEHCEVSGGEWNSVTERCDSKPWSFMPTFNLDKRVYDLVKYVPIASQVEIKIEEEDGKKYLITKTEITDNKINFGKKVYTVDGSKLRLKEQTKSKGMDKMADKAKEKLGIPISEEEPKKADKPSFKPLRGGFLSRLLGNFHAIWN